MKSPHRVRAHGLNIAGWGMIISYLIFLPFIGEPAFVLLAIGGVLCALAIVCYTASAARSVLPDTTTLKQLDGTFDKSLADTQPPVEATELRRLKVAAWRVLTLAAAAFFLIGLYGNAPRPLVEWLNAFVLSPMIAVMVTIMGYALLRFGHACRTFDAAACHVGESDEMR